jgi:hypothetical protein
MAVIIISMVTTIKFPVEVTGNEDGKQARQLAREEFITVFYALFR